MDLEAEEVKCQNFEESDGIHITNYNPREWAVNVAEFNDIIDHYKNTFLPTVRMWQNLKKQEIENKGTCLENLYVEKYKLRVRLNWDMQQLHDRIDILRKKYLGERLKYIYLLKLKGDLFRSSVEINDHHVEKENIVLALKTYKRAVTLSNKYNLIDNFMYKDLVKNYMILKYIKEFNIKDVVARLQEEVTALPELKSD